MVRDVPFSSTCEHHHDSPLSADAERLTRRERRDVPGIFVAPPGVAVADGALAQERKLVEGQGSLMGFEHVQAES